MSKSPKDVAAYLRTLPAERREALEAVRRTILDNLDPRFEEGVQYGMIGYFLPLSEYPAGYHCNPEQPLPFASLASQKNHMALYLFCLYTDEQAVERFAEDWRATGKRLDMGKSCVRFKRLEDVPLEVVGAAIAEATADRFVASYEAQLAAGSKRPAKKTSARKATAKKKRVAKRKTTTRKTAAKKTPANKAAAKKTAAKKTTTKKVTRKSPARKKVATRTAKRKKAATER